MLHLKQTKASSPENSAWVSASAGTGKTKVLTSRVLKLLLAGGEPSKILCLTFTKAAAGEMINRINSYINNWPKLSHNELYSELVELLDRAPSSEELERAKNLFSQKFNSDEFVKVYTIHSFCQYILKRFPVEAGISPNFEVIDEYMTHEITQKIRYKLLQMSGDIHEKKLANSLEFMASNFHDSSIIEIINNIIELRQNFTYLFSNYETCRNYEERLREQFQLAPGQYETEIIKNLKQQITEINLPDSIPPEASEKDTKLLNSIQNFLKDSPEESRINFGGFYQLFLTTKHTVRKNIISSKLKRAREDISEKIDKISQYVNIALEKIKSLHIIFYTKHLYILADYIIKEYQRFKTDGGYLDYNDLIDYAGVLLNDSESSDWVLYKLDGGLHHLLIDEAQDTSLRQWQIIGSLVEDFYSGDSLTDDDRTIFVVGDEKQSIFSFQGARPEIFTELVSYFSGKFEAAGKKLEEINLDISYRSTEAILNVVDHTFAYLRQQYPECFSKAGQEITCHRNGQPGKVIMWPLFTSPAVEEKGFNQWLEHDAAELNHYEVLSHQIALEIKELLDKKYLTTRNRFAREEDILILFRRRGKFTHTLINTLKKYDIKVAGLDRMILTENLAIQDIIAAAKFSLLSEDDLNLACLLKSPLVNLSEHMLYFLATRRGDDSLFKHLTDILSDDSKAAEISTESIKQLQQAYNYLSSLKELYQNSRSVSEFFLAILESHGGRQKLCAALGEEVNDPIDEFIATLSHYEANNLNSGLQEFIYWLENSNIQIKRDAEAGEGLKVMTIHGAKGLQAPIVFLADTTSTPSSGTRFFWDKEGGLYWPGSSDNHNQLIHSLKQENNLSEFSEYLRLLYVAMTRAEDDLYITGLSDKSEPPNDCWYNIIQAAMEELGKKQEFYNEVKLETQDSADNKTGLYYSREEAAQYINQNLQIVYSLNQRTSPEPKQDISKDKSRTDLENDSSEVDLDIRPILLEDNPYKPHFQESKASTKEQEKNKTYISLFSDHEAQTYGLVLHKILEDYIKSGNRELTRNHPELAKLNSSDKQRAINCINNIFHNKQFVDYINNDKYELKSELAIGKKGMENKAIIGRIDLFLRNRTDKEIIIIDYKSDANPPRDNNIYSVPENYIAQLKLYKNSLSEIYKDYKIRAKLLWLTSSWLQDINI